MNEEKNKNAISNLSNIVSELMDKIDELREYGDVSEVLTSALDTQIKLIYKNALAKLLHVENGLITDEYVDIATMVTDEESSIIEKNKEGYRHLTDDEVVFELTPLLERDMLLDDDIEVDDVEEIAVIEDRIEKLFNELTAKEDEIYQSEKTQEEREKAFDELYEKCRAVIAEVMGVDSSLISNETIDLIMHGQIAEYYEGDKLIMKRIPYSEEIVRTVFRDYILENADAIKNEIRAVEEIVSPTSVAPAENIPKEVVTEPEKPKDRVEELFKEYNEKEDKIVKSQISQEEKDSLMRELNTWGKSFIAEILGVSVDEISDQLLSEVVHGDKVEYQGEDSMVIRIVYTEMQLKWLYNMHKNLKEIDNINAKDEGEETGFKPSV